MSVVHGIVRKTHEVKDLLALALESDGAIGHRTLTLGRSDWYEYMSALQAQSDSPLPQRLVLPDLQNLHSLHSVCQPSNLSGRSVVLALR